MVDKVAPVQVASPSTEEVQRLLHGKNYDEIKRKEKELADKAPKVEPHAPWPSTEDVQRRLHGDEGYDAIKKQEKELAEKVAKPEPAAAPVEQKVTVAEPMRGSYKTRETKAEK